MVRDHQTLLLINCILERSNASHKRHIYRLCLGDMDDFVQTPKKKFVRDTPLVYFRMTILDKNYLLRGVKTGLKKLYTCF